MTWSISTTAAPVLAAISFGTSLIQRATSSLSFVEKPKMPRASVTPSITAKRVSTGKHLVPRLTLLRRVGLDLRMAVVEVLVYRLRICAQVEQALDDRQLIGVEVEVQHLLVPVEQTDTFGLHDQ